MIPSKETIDKIDNILIPYLKVEPKRNNMNIWGYSVDPDLFDKTNSELYQLDVDTTCFSAVNSQRPPCNTVACLAGSTLIAAGLVKPEIRPGRLEYHFPTTTEEQAAEFLGITVDQATSLFLLVDWSLDENGWPEEFADRLKACEPGTPEYLQVMLDRLEYFKQTGD